MGSFLEDVPTEGVPFTGVVTVDELGGSGSFAGTLKISKQSVVVFLAPETVLDGCTKVTLINFFPIFGNGRFRLYHTEKSRTFLHETFKAQRLLRIKETCSGIGALGQGGSTIGYKVVVLNEVQAETARVAEGLTGAKVVQGDICELSTLVRLWDADPGDCVFTSGFSCQPYSHLGDRQGGADPRSAALTGSLKAAYLHQASAVMLECVQPAAQDPFVQHCLKEFQEATGYHCSQTVLELHKVWGARRTRWWALLTSPEMGQVQVDSWKAHGPWHAVEDIIDTFNATGSEVEQLRLQQFELEVFEDLKPISSYCIRRNEPLPTALHSWGAALTACPCKCRPGPFTWARLNRDGLQSVVIPLCAEHQCKGFRYPSAQEVALLNGLSPSLNFGPNARLGLILTGQLASPLQSAWLLGALARKLAAHGVVFTGTTDAIQILHTQRRILLREAEVEGYRPLTGGHVLSSCPAICYSTHASILKKAVSCHSSQLPPAKKPKLSSAPQGPSLSPHLCGARGQTALPHGLHEQHVRAEAVDALLLRTCVGKVADLTVCLPLPLPRWLWV